jgi:hypothetical protein
MPKGNPAGYLPNVKKMKGKKKKSMKKSKGKKGANPFALASSLMAK